MRKMSENATKQANGGRIHCEYCGWNTWGWWGKDGMDSHMLRYHSGRYGKVGNKAHFHWWGNTNCYSGC